MESEIFKAKRSEVNQGGSWNNYEKIYDEDEPLKELDTDARLWRVCNDETDRIDGELVDGWAKSLDTQIIFVRFQKTLEGKW